MMSQDPIYLMQQFVVTAAHEIVDGTEATLGRYTWKICG